MHLGSPAGLILLLALPAVVALHVVRRRLRVRRVAGVFLWGTPAEASPPRLDLSFRLGSLPRDVLAPALVALIACNPTVLAPSWSPEAAGWLNTLLRVAACVAVVAVAGAGWRTTHRSLARSESP